MSPGLRRSLGVLGILFYGAHAAYHIADRHPENLLWVCHLGALLVGLGLLFSSPQLIGAGLLWLSIGVPLWILDLATGGEFLPTSPLTHVGGLVLGLVGARQLGLPRHVWWKAAVALIPLQIVCRSFTPPAENVNLAHAVWTGWEAVFPSHSVYLLTLGVLSTAVFFAVETLLRRLGFRAATDGA